MIHKLETRTVDTILERMPKECYADVTATNHGFIYFIDLWNQFHHYTCINLIGLLYSNKNAFQWDACRCVYPSMHWAGGVYPNMHWAGGVYPRGCLPRGRVSAQAGCVADTPIPQDQRQTPPVDRKTPVKTYPSQTSFAGGNNTKWNWGICLWF